MKLPLSLLSLSVIFASSTAFSATETFRAEVTVQNTVVLTKDSDLNFGTIRAVADPSGTDRARLTVNATPNARHLQ